jgi:hypothetical protein
MDLQSIYDSFQKLETVPEKIEFLQELQELNMGYQINYENLIDAWMKLM